MSVPIEIFHTDETLSRQTWYRCWWFQIPKDPKDPEMPPMLAIPWIASLRAALNHGGTRRPKRDRREAKRKQLQLATVDPVSSPLEVKRGRWMVALGMPRW